MSKEEKAMEYVEQNMFNIKEGKGNIIIAQIIRECNQDAYEAYIAGYDSRSSEVDQLRKALGELVELVEDIDDTLFQHNYSIVGWHLNGEQEPIMNFVADFDMDILTKAKSLLKTEE